MKRSEYYCSLAGVDCPHIQWQAEELASLRAEKERLERVEKLYHERTQLITQLDIRAERAETDFAELLGTSQWQEIEIADLRDDVKRHIQIVSEAEAERDAAVKDAEQLREWLNSNMTYYNTAESNGPLLASVSKRIWYHATDDMDSSPFSAAIAARKGDQ